MTTTSCKHGSHRPKGRSVEGQYFELTGTGRTVERWEFCMTATSQAVSAQQEVVAGAESPTDEPSCGWLQEPGSARHGCTLPTGHFGKHTLAEAPTTAAVRATWGTTKTHSLTAGETFTYAGQDRKAPGAPLQATLVSVGRTGIYVQFAGDAEPGWLGGVATRYWVVQSSADVERES